MEVKDARLKHFYGYTVVRELKRLDHDRAAILDGHRLETYPLIKMFGRITLAHAQADLLKIRFDQRK